ncbi:MAG: ADP-ribosylglycohydrolase family protein [Erysipelotrichaceae bacterium]|nr:ADP-ribosylglycohydrolase family protein [Erysipelotrichaceae bacterium]
MNKYDKVLGGLLAGAVGDALGAATETRSTEQIIEKFGGLVTTFITPPEDVFAHGFPAGSVTDDFSLAYFTARAIIDAKGIIDEKTAADALLKWAASPFFVMSGPTTKASVDRLLGIETPKPAFMPANDNGKGTNGSAMKIAPVGLFSNGNIDKAIHDAIIICTPTHNNSTSLSAGCAVAAGVSAAMREDASVDSVIEAGLKGALEGEKHGVRLANPSVYERIKLAVEIGRKYKGDDLKVMKKMTGIIGTGLAAAEAVPSAFGFLAACDGDPLRAVIMGVNAGSDTDTVATIVGAMAGTLNGYYDEEMLRTIDRVNGFDLRKTAEELLEAAENA